MATPMDDAEHRPPSVGSAWVPQIYFARALDGMDEAAILALGNTVARELADHELSIIDPFLEARRHRVVHIEPGPHSRVLVEFDLALLRRCDGVLMDMSIPMRNYVGCVCELTYAFLWRIPAVVYVGDSSNAERHWLKYHASDIRQSRQAAIVALAGLVRNEAVRLGRGVE